MALQFPNNIFTCRRVTYKTLLITMRMWLILALRSQMRTNALITNHFL
jgi:hypothetical protein